MPEINQRKSKESNGRGSGRGGSRSGAGRKAGSATVKTRIIAERAAAEGISPLEFMLNVMRKEVDPELEPREFIQAQAIRFEAAKAAAPYIHPRLAAVEHSGDPDRPVVHEFTWLT